jgi:hypothetical protein
MDYSIINVRCTIAKTRERVEEDYRKMEALLEEIKTLKQQFKCYQNVRAERRVLFLMC